MKHDEGEGIPATPPRDVEREAEEVATNLGPDRIFDSRVLKVHDHHYFEGILRPGDVYVEAGAHEGRFLHASGLYDPRCTYHLIEPQADLPQALWGSKPNVFIHPFVLAAESGDVTLYLRKKHTVGSTTVRSLTNWFRAKRVVRGVAWQDFYTEHVRFFAVNIEGSDTTCYGRYSRIRSITCRSSSIPESPDRHRGVPARGPVRVAHTGPDTTGRPLQRLVRAIAGLHVRVSLFPAPRVPAGRAVSRRV